MGPMSRARVQILVSTAERGCAGDHAQACPRRVATRSWRLKALRGTVEGLDMSSLAMSSESGYENDGDTQAEDDAEHVSSVVVQLLRRPRWQTVGACRGERVEMFIPDRGGPTARAKQLCARCTVRAECLRYALGGSRSGGILGRHQRTRTAEASGRQSSREGVRLT